MVSGFDFPEDLLHEKRIWIKEEVDEMKVGITALGQHMASKTFQV
jgi:glycine cleavage system H lipoate-binding protein